jgi:dUTP pyrophosphatase
VKGKSMEEVVVKFLQTEDDVKLPFYEHDGDSGMDVRANDHYYLPIGATGLVPLGFKVSIPDGYEIQVRPKSGLSLKKGLTVLNAPGTIDSNYRGECGVILHNAGPNAITIEKGDKIAQIVLCPVVKCKWDVVDSLDETTRGDGGYGSTGN